MLTFPEHLIPQVFGLDSCCSFTFSLGVTCVAGTAYIITLPWHLSSSPIFNGICTRVARSLVFRVDHFCLFFFCWPLCCLSFDLRHLIAPFEYSKISLFSTMYLWIVFVHILSYRGFVFFRWIRAFDHDLLYIIQETSCINCYRSKVIYYTIYKPQTNI
jgi:hypothetical protein